MSADLWQGGPAFPAQYGLDRELGMTLRDYFAAKAMHGFIAEPIEGIQMGSFSGDCTMLAQDISRAAYVFADAMLEARKA